MAPLAAPGSAGLSGCMLAHAACAIPPPSTHTHALECKPHEGRCLGCFVYSVSLMLRTVPGIHRSSFNVSVFVQ